MLRTPKIRPFLKWPGGKYRCIDKIINVLPEGARLIEPFTGSGAVFINTHYPDYLLSEINPDLINLFLCLKTEGKEFIHYCQSYFNPKNNMADNYYALRARFNETQDPNEKAALMLYLNRHGFNGLCRYNLKGGYNVPFGRYAKPYFPEEELLFFHKKSQNVTFVQSDFRAIFARAKAGDVIYCDPPYVPLSDTAKFTTYSGKTFGIDDQIALANLAEESQKKGIKVVISNHDTPVTRRYYKKARLYSFKVSRFISCNIHSRYAVKELLAVFNP